MSLVVWVLDSADIDLMRRWVGDGSLPNIAALWKNSQIRTVGGDGWFDEIGTFVTAYSGIAQTRHGYMGARRLKPGTYTLERMRLEDAAARPCWQEMKAADFRALIWDPIEAPAIPGLGGLQVYNASAHQEAFAADPLATVPEDRLEAMRRALEKPRRLRFNRFGRPVDYYAEQLRGNLAFLDQKFAVLRDLVREDYGLITIGFNEIHDVGHLLWPFMDGKSPARDPEGKLADGVHEIYRAIDRQIGSVTELLPAGSTVCLLSAYGMQDQYPSLGLAEAAMTQLGYQVGRTAPARGTDFVGLARRVVPEAVRFEISKHLPSDTQQNLLFSNFAESIDFARSRAFVLPTSLYVSQIRVNLKGREPAGTIAPGSEYTALLDEIEADFRALIDPVDGMPAVERVVRSAGYHVDGPSELIADLFIHWKSCLHFMERAIHPRGEMKQRKSGFHRESGHRKPGFVAISGPGIQHQEGGETCLLNIAPTLLGLMGGKAAPAMTGKNLLCAS